MILFALGFTLGILSAILIPKAFRWFIYPRTNEGMKWKAIDEGCNYVIQNQN